MMQISPALSPVRAGSGGFAWPLSGVPGASRMLLLALISAEVKQMSQNASITHNGLGSDRPSLQCFNKRAKRKMTKICERRLLHPVPHLHISAFKSTDFLHAQSKQDYFKKSVRKSISGGYGFFSRKSHFPTQQDSFSRSTTVAASVPRTNEKTHLSFLTAGHPTPTEEDSSVHV